MNNSFPFKAPSFPEVSGLVVVPDFQSVLVYTIFPQHCILIELVAGAVRKSKSDIELSTLAVSLYAE